MLYCYIVTFAIIFDRTLFESFATPTSDLKGAKSKVERGIQTDSLKRFRLSSEDQYCSGPIASDTTTLKDSLKFSLAVLNDTGTMNKFAPLSLVIIYVLSSLALDKAIALMADLSMQIICDTDELPSSLVDSDVVELVCQRMDEVKV